MSRFTVATMSQPAVLHAINELARDHAELRNPEALEDFVNYARDALPRLAAKEGTKEFTALQGMRRAFEQWQYRRAHPEAAYSQTIAKIARGRSAGSDEDEPEPDLRGPQGESADIVSEAQHERDSGEAIDWLRQRRAGQPGYGREITDEQRERMAEGQALQARRRANGA